jgi:hypothetical protein
MKSVVGTNLNVEPLVVQAPGVAGSSTGSGVAVDNGADIEIVMAPFGATSVDPSTGVTEATLSGAGGDVVVVAEAGADVVGAEVPLPAAALPAGLALWAVACSTRAPVTAPTAKARTTIPTTRSGERLPRALLLAIAGSSLRFEYARSR